MGRFDSVFSFIKLNGEPIAGSQRKPNPPEHEYDDSCDLGGKTSVLNDGIPFSVILWSESGYEFIDIEVDKDLLPQLKDSQEYEAYLRQNGISFEVTGNGWRYAGPQAALNSYVIQFYRDCGE